MENKICSYETLYVVNGNLPEEEMKAVVEKFTALVSENGTLVKVDEWGKRRLAYPIDKVNEGYYVLTAYTANPEFPAEFERLLGIHDAIMRAMTTRVEKIAAPTAAAEAPAADAADAE